ncbi:somatostatin receptor type 5-like [Acropora millepora]|uniref:somatostatin receptor type 5-like n=1 Tax=Acropora millepora TaxID=45264 RepID=UPI001CF323B7|nr:somatostatin receptor type 5-like [Acropora millepora]
MADWFLLGFVIAITPFYIFGLIGNAMVIRIVHKTREMHTTTNYLLANLAVSDAITLFTIPMFFAYIEVCGRPLENFGKFSCKFAVVGVIATVSSTLTLTVIAVERYHAILKPFSSNLRLNEENIKKAIALIWTLSIVVGFPGFFLNICYDEKTCDGPWGSELSLARKIYLITYVLFTMYIPIVVFLFCYGSLIKGLYFSNEICAESTNEDTSEKKKLLITFILATSGFLLGYGPIAVVNTTISLGKKIDPSLFKKLSGVIFFLFLVSLCLNPVLYAFRSSSFKEGFKRIFQPCSLHTMEHNAN